MRALRPVPVRELGLAVLLAAASPEIGLAQPGVSADRVLFGQTAALTGPAAGLGTGMRVGIEAAFAEINGAGGIHGRRLELISLDDGYEPAAALTNARRLLQEEGVFALIGSVGTPTSEPAEQVAEDAGVPYIGPFTGAEFLRDPVGAPTTVNVRASYYQETAEMVRRLTVDLGISRIAVLYQDDSYGNAGLRGVRMALDARGMRLVGQAVYRRNTTAVKVAALHLRRMQPQAVIIIGAYRPTAAFVRWSQRLGFRPVMMNISFVGAELLAADLRAEGEGVLATQVVPHPGSTGLQVVRRYRAALRAHDGNESFGYVSLEGYIVGRVAAEILERAGPSPTRQLFLETLAGMDAVELGGFALSYGPGDNQGSDRVFLTRIEPNGSLTPLGSLR